MVVDPVTAKDTQLEDTLARALEPAAVSFASLREEYGPLLQLVRLIIGVVPNCDPLLAIWPTGFRTYNLLVPNLLNLPFSVWGCGPPAVPLGLALHAASRTARCAYCTAHTCSFALRRGTPAEKFLGGRTPAENAAVAVAEALARIPSDITPGQKRELLRQFSRADAERIVLGVALMGFLNKFMDALGIDLEEAAVEEVSTALQPTGWAPGKHRVRGGPPEDPALAPLSGGRDTLATKLALLRHVPAAIRLESTWTRGVPSRWPAVGAYLREKTGHDFPLLGKLQSRRAVRALATVLRDNLTASGSALGGAGNGVKALAGLVYATVVGNEALASEARSLAAHAEPTWEGTCREVGRFAAEPADWSAGGIADAEAHLAALPGLPRKAALALLLAKAVSPSPATTPAPLLARVSEALSPAAQIELVVWIAIEQMLHRLGSYLEV
jgi:alkylhydroperoxidase family enzyme